MNIQCDVRLEYTANGRSGHRWREGAELSISKDDWSHSVLVIGGGTKKTSFNLEKNIKQIYTSYLSDGKLTITLVSPMVNVYLRKAVVEHLKNFLRLMQHIQKHPNDDMEEVAERWGLTKKPVEESASSSSSDDEEE